MRELHKQIESYLDLAELRLHMPGHKGKKFFPSSIFPCEYDLTELEMTDDLHRPEHVLNLLRERARNLWQAENAYLLTNGSTAGNLIAIHAAYEASKKLCSAKKSGDFEGNSERIVLISRNSHLSVLNALNLLEAKYSAIGNEVYDDTLLLPNTYEEIVASIKQFEGRVALLVLTLPTYEGLYPSDIEKIITYAHSKEIFVHIDAAHGAHLNFLDQGFNLSHLGADFFTISLHKTLPAATSTAILFQGKKSLLNCEKFLDYYYDVFETSSPSYPLLLSIEDCLDYIEENMASFKEIYKRRASLENELGKMQLSYLSLNDLGEKIKIDPLKLTLFGNNLQDNFKSKGIFSEYSNDLLSLLILSLQDQRECELLLAKLDELMADSEFSKKLGGKKHSRAFYYSNSSLIKGARYRHAIYLPMEEACGKVLAKDLYFYPPGVPIKLAGEVFTKEDSYLLQKMDLKRLNGLKGNLVPIDESSLNAFL